MAAAHVLPAFENVSDDLKGRAERQGIVDSALGTTLAEGVSPGPEVLTLSARYIAGEITLQEFGSLVRAMSGV